MTVSVTSLTPELMHMPHNPAQSTEVIEFRSRALQVLSAVVHAVSLS